MEEIYDDINLKTLLYVYVGWDVATIDQNVVIIWVSIFTTSNSFGALDKDVFIYF